MARLEKRPGYWTSKEEVLPRRPKIEFRSKKELGRCLRAIRLERGISQVELAKALGTYQTTISAVERGVLGLTVQQVIGLTRVLEASANDILGQPKATKDRPLRDRRFLRRLEKINHLPKRDRRALLRTIDAFLAKVS